MRPTALLTRYATMASAGLTVKDLQGPALDRLAIKDSRDLLLIEGLSAAPARERSQGVGCRQPQERCLPRHV
jgi:hypothetical protein